MPKVKDKWIMCVALLATIVLLSNACKHGQCNSGSPSAYDGTRSHNMGKNCQSCHVADGPGNVCWKIGGTAYDSLSGGAVTNVTVRFRSRPSDTAAVVLTLEGDAKGNFYTSDDPGLAAGLFPSVTSTSGHTSRMLEPITNGACNSCHGNSTAHIRVR